MSVRVVVLPLVFQKDLIVWKPGVSHIFSRMRGTVSEGLNSVETGKMTNEKAIEIIRFQKDLIVWKQHLLHV